MLTRINISYLIPPNIGDIASTNHDHRSSLKHRCMLVVSLILPPGQLCNPETAWLTMKLTEFTKNWPKVYVNLCWYCWTLPRSILGTTGGILLQDNCSCTNRFTSPSVLPKFKLSHIAACIITHSIKPVRFWTRFWGSSGPSHTARLGLMRMEWTVRHVSSARWLKATVLMLAPCKCGRRVWC